MASSQLLHFHSHDRTSKFQTPETFSVDRVDLPSQVQGYNLRSVALRSVAIPHHCYNVPTGKNTIQWKNAAGGTRTLTVAVGNYTISTLLTALTNAFATKVDVAPWAGDADSATWTQDATNQKVTFRNYLAPATDKAFTWADDVSTLHMLKLLGFNYLLAQTSNTSPLLASRLPNMLMHKYLYVCMHNVQSGFGATRFHAGLSEVMMNVPMDVEFGNLLLWENTTPLPVQFGQTDDGELVSKWEFTLRDNEGKVIDNNGAEWSLSLEGYFAAPHTHAVSQRRNYLSPFV